MSRRGWGGEGTEWRGRKERPSEEEKEIEKNERPELEQGECGNLRLIRMEVIEYNLLKFEGKVQSRRNWRK